jgi:hypothetical protein
LCQQRYLLSQSKIEPFGKKTASKFAKTLNAENNLGGRTRLAGVTGI